MTVKEWHINYNNNYVGMYRIFLRILDPRVIDTPSVLHSCLPYHCTYYKSKFYSRV